MATLIDTHCHLQWEKFNQDLDEVVDRALHAGVSKMITLATDLRTSHQVIELSEKYPPVYAAVGIHPTDAVKAGPDDLKEIEELAQHLKVVAIGETGMDFYWDKTTGGIQKKLFIDQLNLGAKLDLPVIVHNREAGKQILGALNEVKDLPFKGVFHCFGENESYAKQVLDYGFHISFTGNITYKKSGLGPISQSIPLDKLLLETDSPFLAPVPERGKRNEPANVRYIAEQHANQRGQSFEKICKATTENAHRLFKFDDLQK